VECGRRMENFNFIAMVVKNPPKGSARRAQAIGIGLALAIRIVMLLGVVWIMGLAEPLFTVADVGFSFKDILLLAGGLFLIGKSTIEMHHDLTAPEDRHHVHAKQRFLPAVWQIALIDIVFSFDSI